MYAQILLVLILTHSALSANILFLNEVGSPSHHFWNYAIIKGLSEQGHNITLLAPDAKTDPDNLKNYHPIVNEGLYEMLQTAESYEDNFAAGILRQMHWFFGFCHTVCSYNYKTNGFRQLRNYPKDYKFDLIIIDASTGPCYYPFIQQFNYPPTIAVTPFLLPPYLSEYFGNHLFPSYLPFYHFGYTNDMTFSERVRNYFFTHLDMFSKYVYEYPYFTKMAKEQWPEMHDLDQLTRHISLLLANTSPILSFPQPLTPNIIPVGGLHIRPAKKLPSDIQKIVDDSKGIIIFSLGSNVRTDQLKGEKFDAIISALSQLPYTVLFKFESAPKITFPENIFISKWLPINDLLANPKTKLFITHGGALSTHEALSHGVPMIGIPFMTDQHLSCKMLTYRKLGLTQQFDSLTTESLLDKINTILDHPEIYLKNVQLVSQLFKDQQQTPLEEALHWVNLAIKHNGTHFLTPQARNMSYFAKYSKDVEIFLVLSALVTIYIVKKCICRLLKRKTKLD